MKILNKKELYKVLEELLQTKDKNNGCLCQKSNMNNSYFDYRPECIYFGGKHICSTCGKRFGESGNEAFKKHNNRCLLPYPKAACYDMVIFKYKDIVKKFIKMGYDAKLNFNCPSCCQNGKKYMEIVLNLDNNEKVISYPKCCFSFYSDCATPEDYYIALAILCGEKTYEQVFDYLKKYDLERDIDILAIDNAINLVFNKNLTYKKADVFNYVEWNKNILNKCAKEVAENILNNFVDDYIFTIKEFSIICENIACLGDVKGFSDEQNMGLTYCLTMDKLCLNGIKTFQKKHIEIVTDMNYYAKLLPVVMYTNPNMDEKKELLLDQKRIEMEIFEKIYKQFGEDFGLPSDKYVEVLEYLEACRYQYDFEKILQIISK